MQETSYRILIVDDDPGQIEMAAEFLHIAGFEDVDLAYDLQGLWQRLETRQYDIVLLDYKLPDGTGVDALAEFKARGHTLPVVMVTGQGDERVAVQAMQRGAADYLMKSGDYLLTLPSLIRKTIHAHQLQMSVDRSMEQIRYQATLLNNVRDAVVVWDMNGLITYWNPAASALFGWSAAERLGCKVGEVYLPAFNPPAQLPREHDSIGQHVVRQYRTRSQQVIWVSSRITLLRDPGADNRLIGYMDVSHDITRRKEAEEALRAERNFVSAVLDTVGALVVVLDRQGRIARFNRACEQTIGYSFTEVRGKYIWDVLLLAEEQESVRAIFQQVQSGKFPSENEYTVVSKSGDHRLIAWSNTALTNRDGQVEFIIATGIDITARRLAEKALRESEARYRAIVEDYQTELICRFTPNGALTFANEVYCQYFGKSRSELVGANFMSFLPADERYRNVQHLGGFSQANPVATIEYQLALPNQGLRWHQRTDRAIFDEHGRLFEFQSVGRDITDRKRAEEAIKTAQTHLIQAARLATIGEMASGVAHQINNPLTTIIADAQILRRKLAGDAPGRDSVEAIEQAGWRLQEVVQRLLEFSRPATATLESLSVNNTVRRALLLIGAHIESLGINLVTSLDESLPLVRGNPRQLEDLWVNLLLLARDACEDSNPHTIHVISLTTGPGVVTVEVWDDGVPIPPDQLDSIFEPNFVGPSSGRGTGMELSICREIVRQHGGQIEAERPDEHVTIFRVTLPAENLPRG